MLSEDFNKSRQLELYAAMSKEKRRSLDRFDWDNRAADALELARLMPPGPHAPRIFLRVSSLRGKTSRNNDDQCDCRKWRKSCYSKSNQGLAK